jgi:hypothetical protein
MLTPSGPVVATANNQVISGLAITATGTANAVEANGFSDVVITGCLIHHEDGRGIKFDHADRIKIQNCNVIKTNAPPHGANPVADSNSIEGSNSLSPLIGGWSPTLGNRVENGASGVYLVACVAPIVEYLEGHNMRGPFPRGQLVQFNACTGGGRIANFSNVNSLTVAWTEDNINIFDSPYVAISQGLLDGNNSPSGDGIMIEGALSIGCTVDGVDVVHWGNGALAAYNGAVGATFTNTRAGLWHADGGRGPASSGGLTYASGGGAGLTSFDVTNIYDATTRAPHAWDRATMSVIDADGPFAFTPRSPLSLPVPV